MKKLIRKIKAAYHYFFHSWEEKGWGEVNVQVTRKCKYCGKQQKLVDYDHGGGLDGPIFLWEDINTTYK